MTLNCTLAESERFEYLHSKGLLLRKMGQYDESIKAHMLSLSLEVPPVHISEAYVQLGKAKLEQGNCIESIDDFKSAMLRNENNLNAFEYIISAYKCAENYNSTDWGDITSKIDQINTTFHADLSIANDLMSLYNAYIYNYEFNHITNSSSKTSLSLYHRKVLSSIGWSLYRSHSEILGKQIISTQSDAHEYESNSQMTIQLLKKAHMSDISLYYNGYIKFPNLHSNYPIIKQVFHSGFWSDLMDEEGMSQVGSTSTLPVFIIGLNG